MESAKRKIDGVCWADFDHLRILQQLSIFGGVALDAPACDADFSWMVADQRSIRLWVCAKNAADGDNFDCDVQAA
jgi:hypothetical protein